MRRIALIMSTIALVLVLSPITSGSTQVQHLYAWATHGRPPAPASLYNGPTGVSAVPGTVVQIQRRTPSRTH